MIKRQLVFECILCICLVFLVGCTSKDSSARNRIKDLTEINVPLNSEIVYHYNEGDNYFFPVPGRRWQYTVFKFEEKPVDFLSEHSFQEERNEDFEWRYDSEFESHTRASNIPNEYCVNLDEPYLYLKISNLAIYFVYIIESNYLIVFITGT